MSDFRNLGQSVSNWGRWGSDDEKGTLNLITPECVLRATSLVQDGKVYSLAIPFDEDGPQDGRVRSNPQHSMLQTGHEVGKYPGAVCVADDQVEMALQASSQWDSLSHVFYDGQLYNGFDADTVTERGAVHCSVAALNPGVVSHGVLLDVARWAGVPWLEKGTPITPEDLTAVAEHQGVTIHPGAVVLVRTGWRARYLSDGDSAAFKSGEPGLTMECATWFHERDVAALACDNYAVEVLPGVVEGEFLPFHMVAIRDMGMPLSEILDMEELAEDCARDQRYEFMFCGAPLPFTHGVGSPVNPLVMR